MLPDKLSALIRVALADLRKVEADPRYEVSMEDYWHCEIGDRAGVCQVCLAGAVMAKSLAVLPSEDKSPSQFDFHTEVRLLALDHVRQGRLQTAASILRIDLKGFVLRSAPPMYDEDAEAFHAYMLDLASRLEEKGL